MRLGQWYLPDQPISPFYTNLKRWIYHCLNRLVTKTVRNKDLRVDNLTEIQCFLRMFRGKTFCSLFVTLLLGARCFLLFASWSLLPARCSLLFTVARCFLLVACQFLLVACYYLLVTRYFLLVARYFLVVARSFCSSLVTFSVLLVTLFFFRYIFSCACINVFSTLSKIFDHAL